MKTIALKLLKQLRQIKFYISVTGIVWKLTWTRGKDLEIFILSDQTVLTIHKSTINFIRTIILFFVLMLLILTFLIGQVVWS